MDESICVLNTQQTNKKNENNNIASTTPTKSIALTKSQLQQWKSAIKIVDISIGSKQFFVLFYTPLIAV